MADGLKTGYRTVDGLRIRYADSGGSASRQLVLTGPWPESLRAFDRMWPRLSGTARLLAVDLPGFGCSEGRTELLSPVAMGEFLIGILDEWDIRDPHLVCPGVGTAVALFAAAGHPERTRSLVVGGGAAAHPLVVGGFLNELIEAPGIDSLRSRDPRALIQELLAALGPAAPPDDVVADYIESNAGGRFAESARHVHGHLEQLPLLAGLLPRIFTPVQIIVGGRDRIVPVANAEFLQARLPNSRLDVLDAGHLAWEEASREYGAIVSAWVDGGYLTGSAGMAGA